MSIETFDLAVIGEGVAGLRAAGAAAAAGLRTASFEAQLFGGLVVNVNELEPSPDGRVSSGAEYAAGLVETNAALGVVSIQAEVTELRADAGPLQLVTPQSTYRARQVLVASGARRRRLGVPGEAELLGRGVSQCADCDGPLFQGEEVVVVGGGDSAVQEALVLARLCRRVHVVHRGVQFRAQPNLVARAGAESRLAVTWNARVERIRGVNAVEGVLLSTTEGTRELRCAGVFVCIGLVPNSEFLPEQVARDAAGFVLTDGSLETRCPNVWAAGAVRQGCGGFLVEAEAEAQRAVHAIVERLR